MRVLRTAILALALVAPAAAQTAQDFSGRWLRVDVSGVTDGWDVADEVTVRPVVVDRTAAGAPMSPAVRELRIERRTGVTVRTDTIAIGIRGGSVGVGGQATRWRSEHAVEWNGGLLLMWSSTTDVADNGAERVHERAQEWSIDASGQLVIAVRTRAPGEESRRGRLVYRRAP